MTLGDAPPFRPGGELPDATSGKRARQGEEIAGETVEDRADPLARLSPCKVIAWTRPPMLSMHKLKDENRHHNTRPGLARIPT
jgi:hypothetical protein